MIVLNTLGNEISDKERKQEVHGAASFDSIDSRVRLFARAKQNISCIHTRQPICDTNTEIRAASQIKPASFKYRIMGAKVIYS